ncbi:MAG: hypothetical protein LBC74_00840 [Planctomycetaceae bacterium]|nr:hypothetical protein [Planctomycetaceae bacterium]
MSVNIFKAFCFVFILFVIETNVLSKELQEDVLKRRFLSEAPKAWKAIKNEYQKGVSLTLIYLVDTGPLITIEVCLDRKNELNHWLYSGSSSKESVRVINDRYAFYLTKKDNSSDWGLKNFIEDTVAARNSANSGSHKLLPATVNLFDGIMLHEGWLENWVLSDGFSITNIQEVNNEGLVELEFISRFEPYDTYRILRGTICFDPKQSWLIKKYEIEVESLPMLKASKKDMFKITVNLEYQNIEGVPFPKKCQYIEVINGTETHTLIKDYISISRHIPNQKKFYLSHYGLSEPVRATQPGSFVRIVFVVVGLFLILTGLLTKFLTRKIYRG